MNTLKMIAKLNQQQDRAIRKEQYSARIAGYAWNGQGSETQVWHRANAIKQRAMITRLGYALQYLELRLEGRKPNWFGHRRQVSS